MGIFDIFKQSSEPIDVRSISDEDIRTRRYHNKVITLVGIVTLQKQIIVDFNYPGINFDETNKVTISDMVGAAKGFLLHTNKTLYNGKVIVTGKMEVDNLPKPKYSITIDNKSNMKFYM